MVADLKGGPAVVVVAGAGPRGLGMLERLIANLTEFLGGRPIQIHLVDPYPVGGGRIWRTGQPPVLLMNSFAEDVTMYTDPSVRCQGPHKDGPTLLEWAQAQGQDSTLDPAVRRRVEAVARGGFVSRDIQARYLTWVYDDIVRSLPGSATVHDHRATVLDCVDLPDGRQRVRLSEPAGTDGNTLDADAVVLTLGHLDTEPDAKERELTEFARRHHLGYLPPAHSADADLSFVKPGDRVLVRGLGLAFVDLMALLFEGRGGRFHPRADGTLAYEPSGTEPILSVGSRRGVPYQAKPAYSLKAGRAPLPRFFTPKTLMAVIRTHDRVDLREHIWPLIRKEAGWGYYHELFRGHPERVNCSWEDFAEQYEALTADSAEMRILVEKTVPDPSDRIDLDKRDRPLTGVRLSSLDDMQKYLRGYIREDLRRHLDPACTPELGAFYALLSVFGMMGLVWNSGRLTAASQSEGLVWWQGLFNHLTSGPPPLRLRELLALSEAGYIELLGSDMWVEASEPTGSFRAGSANFPGVVEARLLVEARLPEPSVTRTRDPLLEELLRRGEVAEDVLSDPVDNRTYTTGLLKVTPSDCRLLNAQGEPHPRRFALGAFTTLRSAAAFHRPHTNAAGFRQNDFVARTLLETIREATDQAVDTT